MVNEMWTTFNCHSEHLPRAGRAFLQAKLSKDQSTRGKMVVSWSLLATGNARSVGVALIYSTSTAVRNGSAQLGFVLLAVSGFHPALPLVSVSVGGGGWTR